MSEEFTVKRDNEKDLKFTGELLNLVSSSPDQAMGSAYSGSTGRWTQLTLYRTAGGKYICGQVGYTQWQGEKDRYSGAVCDNEAEVVEFFGNGWLAKLLYDEAGIEAVEVVE
jgi:hypothetical protein